MDYYNQNQQQPGYSDPGQQQPDAATIQPPPHIPTSDFNPTPSIATSDFNPMWNMNQTPAIQSHSLQQEIEKVLTKIF